MHFFPRYSHQKASHQRIILSIGKNKSRYADQQVEPVYHSTHIAGRFSLHHSHSFFNQIHLLTILLLKTTSSYT